MQIANSSYFATYPQRQSPPEAPRSSSPTPSSASADEDQSANPPPERSQRGEPAKQTPDKSLVQQQLEQLELARMISRDQEVRVHEQAHAAVGGRYAGAPAYTFEQGPDGKRYAVSGEVSIDVAAVPNDPEATMRKMEVVIRAALSPAEPSAQDRQVAAQAQIQMAEARAELAQLRREQAEAAREARVQKREDDEQRALERDDKKPEAPADALDLYRQTGGVQGQLPLIDLAV
jgi:hypothetical protein